MIERKSILLLLALAAFALVSVPGVIFNDAVKKYFSFMGGWNTATIKLSRLNSMPPTRPRRERPQEPEQPELRFVRFSIKIAGAREVKIAGDFNKWDATATPLADAKGTGDFSAVVALASGAYEYKFVINGTWCVDPDCTEWVQNSLGTLNSVCKV